MTCPTHRSLRNRASDSTSGISGTRPLSPPTARRRVRPSRAAAASGPPPAGRGSRPERSRPRRAWPGAAVTHCTSSSRVRRRPAARSRSTSATSATLEASRPMSGRWNIDSPANRPPRLTPYRPPASSPSGVQASTECTTPARVQLRGRPGGCRRRSSRAVGAGRRSRPAPPRTRCRRGSRSGGSILRSDRRDPQPVQRQHAAVAAASTSPSARPAPASGTPRCGTRPAPGRRRTPARRAIRSSCAPGCGRAERRGHHGDSSRSGPRARGPAGVAPGAAAGRRPRTLGPTRASAGDRARR